MDLAPDFDEFIECLFAHGVDFVIVGDQVGWVSGTAYVANAGTRSGRGC